MSAVSEQSKAVVKQLAELYKNGGLDANIGVKGDFDDAYADFGNGTLGAVNFGFGYPGQFRDFFKSAWLIDDLAVGQALTSNGSYGKTYSTGTWINSHYFIPTSCAYPDRVLDLVEFLASNAGQDLLHNCVNGEFNTRLRLLVCDRRRIRLRRRPLQVRLVQLYVQRCRVLLRL